MTALITIKTFNGHAINDGASYEAKDINGAFTTLNSAKPTWIPQDKSDQIYSGTYTVDTRTLVIAVKIIGSDKNALAATLRVWLKRGSYGNLVVTFSDDSTDYQLPCVVTSLVSKPSDSYDGDYVVSLQTSTTAWTAVTASTDTWSYVPDTAETKTIEVGGTDTTKLIAAITPTGNPAAGYLYQANYLLSNVAGGNFGHMYPHCITVNTAALVTAGYMQASCNDLRVYLNGVSVPRWITGANTSTTKVWCNVALKLEYALTTNQAWAPWSNTPITINNSIPYLQYYATQYPSVFPNSGNIRIDREVFTYSSYRIETGYGSCYGLWGYIFTITSRAAYGTTAAAHAQTAPIYKSTNSIVLMYGNALAEDPAASDVNYDTYKPVFDLTTSDNTKWIYTSTTGFYDVKRPGAWKYAASGIAAANNRSYHYDYYQENIDSGSAAMGFKLSSYKSGNAWTALTNAYIAWYMIHVAGISKLTVTGYKKRNMINWLGTLNIANPPALAGLQKSADFVNWTNVWTEPTSGSAGVWQAIATSGSATVNNWYARIILAAGTAGLPKPTTDIAALGYGCENNLEISSATVEFVQGNLPLGVLGDTVMDHIHLVGMIKNTTNSNAVQFDFPMVKNKTFTFDSETAEATYEGNNAYNSIAINDNSRSTWIGLEPGHNSLTIDSGSMGDSTIALSWYRRRV